MVAELSVSGAALGRLVRRGLEAAPSSLEQLRLDAGAYERAGPEMEIKPEQLLPVLVTGLFFLLVLASLRYTVGDIMSSLAMIESPSSTTIMEPRLPAYSEIVDDTCEKEPLTDKIDVEADVEVTIIKHKPITASPRTTMAHLQRQGGFFSRWRGLGWSFFYHTAHSMLVHLMAAVFGFSWISNALFFMATSILLSRLHIAWTHAMIAQPTTTSFYQQLVPSKYNARVLVLPTLVFAFAQQVTIAVPLTAAAALGLMGAVPEHVRNPENSKICSTMLAVYGVSALAVFAIGVTVIFALLLPASITLTRIEASLLPEGRQAIVPFDRDAIVGELDLTKREDRKALFVQAWRSVDCAAKMRLIKVYLQLAWLQLVVVITGTLLIVSEVYVIGVERLAIFFKSAQAQIQLAMIEGEPGFEVELN